MPVRSEQSVLLNRVYDKPVVAEFDQAHNSSDGGLLLLQAADRKLGLSERLRTGTGTPPGNH